MPRRVRGAADRPHPRALATSYLFAGDPESGQPYLHLEDLVEAVARVVDRRRELPTETVLLLGEPETYSYATLQRRIGELLHGQPWPTRSLPKELVKAGAWVQDEVLEQDPFIKPWMVDMADDHYALNIGRAGDLLGWAPRHRLLATLPEMIERLEADPPGWYRANKLNPATVAAAEPVLERVRERDERGGPVEARALREAEARLTAQRRRTLWAHLVNMALGVWRRGAVHLRAPDPVTNAVPPPAAGADPLLGRRGRGHGAVPVAELAAWGRPFWRTPCSRAHRPWKRVVTRRRIWELPLGGVCARVPHGRGQLSLDPER